MREVEIYLTGNFASWFTTAAWVKERFEDYGWDVIFVQLKYPTDAGAWYIRANVDSRYSKEQISQNAAHVATNFINLPVAVIVVTGDGAPISKRYTVTPPLAGINNSQTVDVPIKTITPKNNSSNNNQPPSDPNKESELTKAYKKLAEDLKISPTTLGICAAAIAILVLRR